VLDDSNSVNWGGDKFEFWKSKGQSHWQRKCKNRYSSISSWKV